MRTQATEPHDQSAEPGRPRAALTGVCRGAGSSGVVTRVDVGGSSLHFLQQAFMILTKHQSYHFSLKNTGSFSDRLEVVWHTLASPCQAQTPPSPPSLQLLREPLPPGAKPCSFLGHLVCHSGGLSPSHCPKKAHAQGTGRRFLQLSQRTPESPWASPQAPSSSGVTLALCSL